ncbi:MAG: VWA domain-containing protein [Oscillochloris sp.]|nr:VWA domain-containing protein [Oscillochloris sp.]
MSLLAPVGLLALLTLPLIILLHLMRERRRRVVVPSLLLWQLLPVRQEAQRRRRLPLSLLLLLHLLAAALLALALSQPQWLTNLFGREQHLAVIIDTSASMAAPSNKAGTSSRLDAARARARSLIGSLGGRDTLTLISAGSQARLRDSAGATGKTRLLAALDSLTAGGNGSDIAGALTLAAADMQGRATGQAIVITDAALPTLEEDLNHAPNTLAVAWERVGPTLSNQALITLAARQRSSSGPIQVYARAANYGNTAERSIIRLYGDEQLLDTRQVSIPAQGDIEITWTAPSGIGLLRAVIDGHDALASDNEATFSLTTIRPLRTLLVSANPAAIQRALQAVPGMSLQVIEPNNYVESSTSNIDLTILDGILPENWPPGAVLVINPPTGYQLLAIDAIARNTASDGTTLQSSPNTTIFAGISLGSVDFGPIPEITPPDWAQVQLSRGTQPLILRGSVEQSEVAIWAFDLTQSNLTSRLAFPLLLIQTIRDLSPASLPSSALAGQAVELRPDRRTDKIESTAPDGTINQVHVARGETVALAFDDPGVYTLRELSGSQEIFVGQLPVNTGSAIESDLTAHQLPATTSAPPATAEDAESNKRPLWPWLVSCALVVMLGEWIYVHARRANVVSST